MTETIFRFLMSDGMMSTTFSPALTPDQYTELLALVSLYSTKDELRKWIEFAAEPWGVTVTFDFDAA